MISTAAQTAPRRVSIHLAAAAAAHLPSAVRVASAASLLGEDLAASHPAMRPQSLTPYSALSEAGLAQDEGQQGSEALDLLGAWKEEMISRQLSTSRLKTPAAARRAKSRLRL